jgi:Uma2 family endonuclease
MAGTRVATEADLLRMPRDGRKYELVEGAIVMTPAGSRHGQVAVRLSARLLAATENGRGHVFDSSTGFRLPGGNVRSPDVSFVAAGRFPGERVPEGFPELAPDLAVEILSPEDRAREVMDKVGELLDAGVRLVWVIDPRGGRAVAYRSPAGAREIGADGDLDGEDVLPGFRCPLAALFG